MIICSLHNVDLENCKRDLNAIKDHINYAKERTSGDCVFKGDLAFWRKQKKKINKINKINKKIYGKSNHTQISRTKNCL